MYGLFSLVVWGIKKAQIITYICMFSLKLIGTSKQIIFLCFSPHGDGGRGNGYPQNPRLSDKDPMRIR